MTGISDLKTLLKNMNPRLVANNLVFCSVSEEQFLNLNIFPTMIFKEEKGITLIIRKDLAIKNLLCDTNAPTWSMISLTVHSSLEAVGFLATITTYLAKFGISTNVVSAYYHDHLFVQNELADKVIKLLKNLSLSSYP
ncbi:MAG: ACT domain-containing protein [Candidatus Hodarchaeota archaeon]